MAVKRHLTRKLIAVLTSLAMVVGMTPTVALAKPSGTDNPTNAIAAAVAELEAAGDPSASKTVDGLYTRDAIDAQLEGLTDEILCHVMVESELTDSGEQNAVRVYASPLWDPNYNEIALLSNMTESDLYSTLRECWQNQRSTVSVSRFGLTRDNIRETYYCAVMDNPDCFNVRTGLKWSVTSSGAVLSVSPNYLVASDQTYDGLTFAQMQSAFDAQMTEALSHIQSNMTDLAKVTILHDWLCNHANYAAGAQLSEDAIYTAYGTIVKQYGVCQSYTTALGALLKAADIESVGLMVNPLEHAWNLVKIDGLWYQIDATWNDQSYGIIRNYFLKSDEAFLKHEANGTHAWLLGPSYDVFGYNDSLACTSTRFDSYNWSTYNPSTDFSTTTEPTNPPGPTTPDVSDLTSPGAPDPRMDLLTLDGVQATFEDGTYPWIIGFDDKLFSDNMEIDSTESALTIVLESETDLSVSFDWGVSSERDYDFFTISVDSENPIVAASGEQEDMAMFDLDAGRHEVTLKYKKDVSFSSGADRAWIANFTAGPQKEVIYSASQGSADFLRWIAKRDPRLTKGQVENTINQFATPEYETNLGASGDATSLENMTTLAALVNEINRLRATEGTSPLTIDPLLLFEAQCRTNYGAKHSHHDLDEGMASAENLAYGNRTPENAAQAWWSEKSIWTQALEENPELANMSSYELFNSYYDFYLSVGHYLNMRDPSFTVVGAGLSNSGRATYGSCYSYPYYSVCSYTVSEFEALLNEYLGVVGNTHQHNYGKPRIEFNGDSSKATATWTCSEDPSHTFSMTKDVTITEISPRTCYFGGETRYYVRFDPDVEGAQSDFRSTTLIPSALGHSYNSLNLCTRCNHLRFDVNKSKTTNIVDAQIAFDISCGIYDDHEAIDEFNIDADANGDGFVNALDARVIQVYVLTGKIG